MANNDETRREELNQYLTEGIIPDYEVKSEKQIYAEKFLKKTIEEVVEELYGSIYANNDTVNLSSESNVKLPTEIEPEIKYEPKKERAKVEKIKKFLIRIMSLAAVGLTIYGGVVVFNAKKEYDLTFEAEQKISTVMIGRSDGINGYQGETWYEQGLFADKIEEKNNASSDLRLYYQLSWIYAGLYDYTKGTDLKLNDEHENGYTSKEWIEKIYRELNRRVKLDNGVGLGPEEFSDWLSSIGMLPEGKDPFEHMLDEYRRYLEAVKTQIENGQTVVTLLPAAEVIETYGNGTGRK